MCRPQHGVMKDHSKSQLLRLGFRVLVSPLDHCFEISSKLASGVCLTRNNNTAQLLYDPWNRVAVARGLYAHQLLPAFVPEEPGTHDLTLGVRPVAQLGLLHADKKHSFHNWGGRSGGRRRCQSPERSEAGGRESEPEERTA